MTSLLNSYERTLISFGVKYRCNKCLFLAREEVASFRVYSHLQVKISAMFDLVSVIYCCYYEPVLGVEPVLCAEGQGCGGLLSSAMRLSTAGNEQTTSLAAESQLKQASGET